MGNPSFDGVFHLHSHVGRFTAAHQSLYEHSSFIFLFFATPPNIGKKDLTLAGASSDWGPQAPPTSVRGCSDSSDSKFSSTRPIGPTEGRPGELLDNDRTIKGTCCPHAMTCLMPRFIKHPVLVFQGWRVEVGSVGTLVWTVILHLLDV